MVKIEGSVRVDLLGGTLDLWPINLILHPTITLNVATSLKAHVELDKTNSPQVSIYSTDYNKNYEFKESDFKGDLDNGPFGPMRFVAEILKYHNLTSNISLKLKSGSPPGAGLGGSSAMGVTLFKACLDFKKEQMPSQEIVKIVQSLEAKILVAGPAGYQDYYPALYGGVLALIAHDDGIEVEQLYTKKLKEYLESHISLVYSGQTRNSGINNWEVYKGFFDKDKKIIAGLETIAKLSKSAYQSIKNEKFDELLNLIKEEGKQREKLFPSIMTKEMKNLAKNLEKDIPSIGVKVCGAGGGGCFILTHPSQDAERVQTAVKKASMELLDFSLATPL